MKKLILLTSLLTLISCVETKVPETKIDEKIFEPLKAMSICDKSDSDMPLAEFGEQSVLIVKDTIETKDLVNVDCAGKQTNAGRGPVRRLSQFLAIDPPDSLKEKVNFVHINNLRTCAAQKMDADDDQLLDPVEVDAKDGGKSALTGLTFSGAGHSGKLKVLLSDSTFKISSLYLNVLDKNNVFEVRYYGKCRKYKEPKDEKMDESFNCEDAELLAEKKVLVSVQIERPEGNGTHEVDVCTDKETDK